MRRRPKPSPSATASSATRSGGRDIDSILQRYRGGSASGSSSAGSAGTGSSALERLRAGRETTPPQGGE